MSRKDGGSLFHQMIHAPDVFVRQDRKDNDGNPIPVSFDTRKNYCDWLHWAAEFFRSQGITRLSDIGADKIQDYELFLEENGKTPSTIHDYLAPVCKAAGISMKEIDKPKREASGFVSNSGKGAKDGGRPAVLNRVLGVRESELRHLHGNDLMEKRGVLYVIVRSGKGGKYQEQKILPKDEALVRSFFDGSPKKLFRADEFSSNFNYHAQRRALAISMYDYYNERIKADPNYRKELYREIAGQWHDNNKKQR